MSKITYRQVGDYLIPNLSLPPEEAKVALGKWGMIYKDYLFNHKKVVFSTLLAEGKLYQHCAEIEKQRQKVSQRNLKSKTNWNGFKEWGILSRG